MKRVLQQVIRAPLRLFGVDVVSSARRRSLGDMFEQLVRMGIRPRTVVDVGVGYGTPELYRAFPDAELVLIDPLEEFEPVMREVLIGRKGRYVVAAAGSQAGSGHLTVIPDHPQSSTLLGTDRQPNREVPIVRVDDLALEGPFLIKADVQGAELQVVLGAQGVLSETEAVVLEVSLFRFHDGTPDFADVVTFMRDRGFVVYDITAGHQRPLDDALAQVDLIFVPENGVCRTSHRYS